MAQTLNPSDLILGIAPPSFWKPKYISESAWLEHAPFAFWLVAATRPSSFVELGSHAGFSYFAFCQAVKKLRLETKCHAIDTWGGDEHAGFYSDDVFERVSAINMENYDDFSRLIRCRFDDALDQFPDGSIDLLHIDGCHKYEDVQHDFITWLPKLSHQGIVLFHDTRVRERGFGVFRLWSELVESYPNFEFHHGYGLGVIAVGQKIPEAIRPLFDAGAAGQEAIRAAYEHLGETISKRYELDQALEHQAVELQAHSVALIGAREAVVVGQRDLETVRGQLQAHSEALIGAREAMSAGQRDQDSLRQQLATAQALLQESNAQCKALERHAEELRRHAEGLRAECIERSRLVEVQRDAIAWLTPAESAARAISPPKFGLDRVRQSIMLLRNRKQDSKLADQAQRPKAQNEMGEPRPASIAKLHTFEKSFIEAEYSKFARCPKRIYKIRGSNIVPRICIFSFYDPQGIVDEYVIFLLQKLHEFAETIIFYSNGPLSRDSEIKLKDVVDDVVIRPNVGFDVLAYKEGLERIDFNREGLYDEVLLVNHTCYGPVFPFSELFGEMEGRDCDFWGVSAHEEMTPNPLTGVGTLPYHLNSNFIAVRAAMLSSLSFRKYWEDLSMGASYEEAIMSHEARFTEYFTHLGYKASCYLDKRVYGTHYPAMLDLDETLVDRNPLIKRRAFFHDPRFFEHFAADLPRALSILAKTSDYDQELIWRNAVRQAELRTLNTNAALTSVLPDVRLKQDAPLHDYGAIAVCAHVYYTDMLEEILSLADTIPTSYDFIATTDTDEKKAVIEQTATGRKNVRNVIVRIVEQNRGRDMSALFISCRDLFIDDRYSLVCRLHTKKMLHLKSGRANQFKRHMFENLLNSEGYTTNVLDMFHDKPWIGVAVPPLVHISYGTMGHAWSSNREKAEEVKKLINLKVPFDQNTPVGAFGGMFWFRPRALHKLFAHPWKWTDYDSEPNPALDGTLTHAQERLISYVAQDAGYTTEQIVSLHLAGFNYAMLEYKLQKLSAALPNPDFSYQCHLLEEWCSVGYPRSQQPVALLPPPSATGSLDDLRLAIKRHLRSFERKVIRPFLHAISLRAPKSNDVL